MFDNRKKKINNSRINGNTYMRAHMYILKAHFVPPFNI